MCIIVRTYVLYAMATESAGETKEEEPLAAARTESARGKGGKAEDGESAGAAKQGGKGSSVPISAHHVNSGTRVVSTSASGVRGVILSASVPS